MKKYFLATVLLSCLISAEVKAHPPFSMQEESRIETRVSSKNAPQIREEREDQPTFQSRLGSIFRRGAENFRSNLGVLPYVFMGILALEALEIAEAAPGRQIQCVPGPAFWELCNAKFRSMDTIIRQYLNHFHPSTNGSYWEYCHGLYNLPSELMARLDFHETVEQAGVWPQP